jgi:hypothetical protein
MTNDRISDERLREMLRTWREHYSLTAPEKVLFDDIDAALARRSSPKMVDRTFAIGDRVRKRRGSSWQGRVVGFYSTGLTPEGYAVESEREPGSVQIYPLAALEAKP